MENLIRQPFWNAMNPAGKAKMMSRVAGLYDMQASAVRISLQSRMQDDTARLEAGKDVDPISRQQWETGMPLQASPAERMKLEKTFRDYQRAMTLQPVFQEIIHGSAQQGTAAVQAVKPQETDPDFRDRQQLFTIAQAKLSQVLRARETDPGGWLQQYSPVAQDAFRQYQSGGASGEYLASRLQAEKDRLGINSKKILPDSMADSLLHQIDSSKESDITVIQATGSSFGRYASQVMRQVQKSAYPALQVVMATENPRAAVALWQNRAVKTPDLRGGLDKYDADTADTAWRTAAKSFAATMVVQPGGTAVWNNFNEQGRRLTYISMQRGMSATAAAKQAYEDLLGGQYQISGTWRLPVRSGLDLADVKDGADAYLSSLKAENIMALNGDPRLPESVNRAQSLSRIRKNAQWITNSDETGLTLMMNGLLVNGAGGNPLTVPFRNLAESGAGHRSAWNSLVKDLSRETIYTPGETGQSYEDSNRRTAEELGKMFSHSPADMATGMREASDNLHR